MRQYVYDSKIFSRKVTFVGAFCILIAVYSCLMLLTGKSLFWIVLLVSAYQLFNTFISISNPSEVTIGDESIAFSAYGKTHSYRLDEITSLRIREIDPYKKLYIRVNDATIFRGRYWVNCHDMNDGRELWDILEYMEYEKEPEQLKFRARIPKKPFTDMDETKEEEQSEDDTNGE